MPLCKFDQCILFFGDKVEKPTRSGKEKSVAFVFGHFLPILDKVRLNAFIINVFLTSLSSASQMHD